MLSSPFPSGRGAGGAGLLAALLITLFALFQALGANNFQDFFIYRAGAEIGIRGESPYSIERLRALVRGQFPDENPDENSFVNNCGYFLPPLAVLVFVPFALLPLAVAKVAWAVVVGFAAFGIATIPTLFRAPPQSALRFVVPLLLVLNPLVLAVVVVGQTTVVVVGCVAAGLWCFARGRLTLGVVLWSVAFVKPHVALPLIPLCWYLAGWKRALALVGFVGALNVIGATVAGGSPLFLRDYLEFLPNGHKAVRFNQAALNPQITSWNRLLVSCGGPVIELSATLTVASHLVWGGLVLGKCARAGVRPSAPWACAAAVAGAVVCSQVLAYELLWLVAAVPWVRDLFAAKNRAWAWLAVLVLAVQLIPVPPENPAFDFYRPSGALAFAVLVLFGPLAPGEGRP